MKVMIWLASGEIVERETTHFDVYRDGSLVLVDGSGGILVAYAAGAWLRVERVKP